MTSVGSTQLCQQLLFIFDFTLSSSLFSFWIKWSTWIPCLDLITFHFFDLWGQNTNKQGPVPAAQHLFLYVLAWNCLLTKTVPIMQLKWPVEFPKTVYGWAAPSRRPAGLCWRGATFISSFSVWNKRVNLWSGAALSLPFSYKSWGGPT